VHQVYYNWVRASLHGGVHGVRYSLRLDMNLVSFLSCTTIELHGSISLINMHASQHTVPLSQLSLSVASIEML